MRALVTFHTPGRLVVEGEDVDAADPVFAGREHLFEPAAEPEPAKPKARPRKAAGKAKG